MTSDTAILRNHIKKAWDKAYHLKYKTNPPKNVDTCLDTILGNLESCFTELETLGVRGSNVTKPKRYPKPDYDKCNAGHKLVEVYDEKRNAFVWDCPICIKKMQEA